MHSIALLSLLLAAEPSGEAIYTGQCAICHGQRGEGGRGAPLARANLRHAPDDAALQRVIRRGIPGTGMPGTWLNEREAKEVAAHVRSLGRAVTPVAVPGDPVKGEAIYRGKGGCVGCHSAYGPDLAGIASRRAAAHIRQSVVDPGADVSPDFVLRAVRLLAGADLSGRLGALRVPVLLLHGDSSPFIPVAVMADLRTRLPDARLQVFAHAKHGLPFSHAKACAQTLRGFLDDVDARE